MFSYFLKPFLGLLTFGGLGTGSYFLYKYTISKIETSSQEGISEGNPQGSGSGQGVASTPTSTITGNGGDSNSGGGTSVTGTQGGTNGSG